MKHASAKVRRKIKNKFVSAILKVSAIEEQRERSMRMRQGRQHSQDQENGKSQGRNRK